VVKRFSGSGASGMLVRNQLVKVPFPAGLRGGFQFDLEMEKKRNPKEAKESWQGVTWKGEAEGKTLAKVKRVLEILPMPGYVIKAEEAIKLVPSPVAKFTRLTRAEEKPVLAFSGEDREAGLDLLLTPEPLFFSVEQHSAVCIRLGEIAIRSRLVFDIKKGGMERLELEVPEAASDLKITGKGLLSAEGQGGQRPRRWTGWKWGQSTPRHS